MKNIRSFTKTALTAILAIVVISFSSCSRKIIPTAINTVNAVGLSELNLERKDYKVLKTITAEAIVKADIGEKKSVISEINDEYEITYTKKSNGLFARLFNHGANTAGYEVKCKGIVKLGYLSNGYAREALEDMCAEEIAIRTAKYRLINMAQQMGADGIIEPIISTNIEQIGRDIVIKTTAQGKPIVLKND